MNPAEGPRTPLCVASILAFAWKMIPMISPCKSLLIAVAILSSTAALAQHAQPDVCPNDNAAFTSMQQRAEANDPAAQVALASCYDLGLHVLPDGKEGIRLLTQAACQNYAPAQYELGRIYLYGRGIP